MSNIEWIDAAGVDDVPQDDVIGMLVGGRDMALYNAGGEIFATDNICTHGQARLCEGRSWPPGELAREKTAV